MIADLSEVMAATVGTKFAHQMETNVQNRR